MIKNPIECNNNEKQYIDHVTLLSNKCWFATKVMRTVPLFDQNDHCAFCTLKGAS